MKFSKAKHLHVMMYMSLLLTTFLSASQTFKLNHHSTIDNDIQIVSVEYKDDSTVVNLEYVLSGEAYEIGISPVNDASAFVLTDVTHTKRFKLLEIKGIAILPKTNNLVKKGDNVHFSLVFEKTSLREFDMFEGYVHNSDYEYWHFENVKTQKLASKKDDAEAKLISLSDANFLETVKTKNKLIVVKFWASWCGACKDMNPIYHEAAKSMQDKVIYATMNTESDDVMPTYLKIEYLPTIILFKNGIEVSRSEGTMERTDLVEWIYLYANTPSK